ncbi:MAG: hypothetical protein ACYTFX_10580, partial [Planctomycetota bacterium]
MSGGLDPNMGKEALTIASNMWPQLRMVDTFLGGGGKGTLAGATAPEAPSTGVIGSDMFPVSAPAQPTGGYGFGGENIGAAQTVDLGGFSPGVGAIGTGRVQEAPEGGGKFKRFTEGLG